MKKFIIIGQKEYTGMGVKASNLTKLDIATMLFTSLCHSKGKDFTFGIYKSESLVYLEEVKVIPYSEEAIEGCKKLYPREESYFVGVPSMETIIRGELTHKEAYNTIDNIMKDIENLELYGGDTYEVLDGIVYKIVIEKGELVFNEEYLPIKSRN